jgi:hypothetical protein
VLKRSKSRFAEGVNLPKLWTPKKHSKSEEGVSPNEVRSQSFDLDARDSGPSIRRNAWRTTNVLLTRSWEKSKGRAPSIHEMQNNNLI